VQNWRADVSAILTSAGLVKEWVKYTSYGIPVRIDPGDYNRDGFVNGADFDDYGDDFDNARAEADVNFDTWSTATTTTSSAIGGMRPAPPAGSRSRRHRRE
jgi:hypothetical protein